MSAQDLSDYLQNSSGATLLLDVREPWEFDTCHIEGSVLVPMRQIPSAVNELDPDQETVVICHHGIRSRSVAAYLANLDFNRIINLSGGIDQWAKEVDASMPTY
ncbi:MAG: rhodanese-like domain-containing protein [Pseudomonadota bacterium]